VDSTGERNGLCQCISRGTVGQGLLSRRLSASLEGDEGFGDLASLIVGNGDYRALQDGGVLIDGLDDLAMYKSCALLRFCR